MTREKSPMQYAIMDSRTGQPVTPWQRVWKTKLLAMKFEKLQAARRIKSLVIKARVAPVHGDPVPGVAHRPKVSEVEPSKLKDPTSPYYWDTLFARRSGRRRLPPS